MITTVLKHQPTKFAVYARLVARRHASAVAASSVAAPIAAATSATTTTSTFELCDPNPELVDARLAPSNFVPSLAVVYRDFCTEEEAQSLVSDVQVCLKRRRYEMGHWDSVIVNYKETELHDEESIISSDISKNLLDRVRYQLQERHLSHKDFTWLPCHVIDLHKDGELNAHVDSVRFSGDIVAGLSLLSPSIMRLVPDDDGDVKHGLVERKKHEAAVGVNWVDLYLPPRSLYVLADAGRYHYSHQLLPSGSVFCSNEEEGPITVQRDHRISVIFRDAKD
ncbi:AlkB, alkylation repair homolog [Seminavis robusta]|uniref:AlkB, alkylation repair homolog n=1 Tax=Seminavis robusta TaxID=568900 RepID=A0A9N8HFZ3_9STRA|nr:AlkB, alkylation repair homolog [Seminavis robusta]|eukprot:Sro482_g151920.1 AlkB, alkylation repair homolog (280) ;mRNA; f:60745-61992